MRGPWRIVVIAGAIVVAVVLFAVLRGGDDDNDSETTAQPPPAGTNPTPTGSTSTARTQTTPAARPAANAIPVNANASRLKRATVDKGERVLLVITGPAGEEVHLHGYDRVVVIPPSGPARLAFQASLPGRFEVELEESSEQIAEITVRP